MTTVPVSSSTSMPAEIFGEFREVPVNPAPPSPFGWEPPKIRDAPRPGWVCPRCDIALSPSTQVCPRCIPGGPDWMYGPPLMPVDRHEGTDGPDLDAIAREMARNGERPRIPVVPGFTPGDKVWPKTGGPMVLQQAPQTILATYDDPEYGHWLWLDGGHGHFGSWAAAHWTAEEPDETEKAAREEKAQRRAEENERLAATGPRRMSFPFRDAPIPAEPVPDRPRGKEDAAPAGLYPLPFDDPGSATVTREWAEAFPGMEARLRDCWDDADGAEAVIEYRIATCAEAEAKRPPRIELPLAMNRDGYIRLVRAQRDQWTAVFPGLQVRGVAVGVGKDGNVAHDLEFRLTPKGGEDRATVVTDAITIRLPAGMAAGPGGFPMQQLANLDGEWRDVFPGQLQARLQQPPLAARIGGPATVAFRIPPKDGDGDDG